MKAFESTVLTSAPWTVFLSYAYGLLFDAHERRQRDAAGSLTHHGDNAFARLCHSNAPIREARLHALHVVPAAVMQLHFAFTFTSHLASSGQADLVRNALDSHSHHPKSHPATWLDLSPRVAVSNGPITRDETSTFRTLFIRTNYQITTVSARHCLVVRVVSSYHNT
jgi:hypothetical protein